MANFLGEYCYVLDEKGRFKMPSKFRKGVAEVARDTFVITRGLDHCLYIIPADEWVVYTSRLRKLPQTKKINRQYMHKMLQGASEVTMDKQGRITLPQSLFSYADLKRDIVICGQLDRIEVWSPSQYDAYMNDPDVDLADVAEHILYDTSE